MQALERDGLAMTVFGPGGNNRLGLALVRRARRDPRRSHRGPSRAPRRRRRRADDPARWERAARGARRRRILVHQLHDALPEHPARADPGDSGIVCAPQFAHGVQRDVRVLRHAPLVSRRARRRRAGALSAPRRRRAEAAVRPAARAHGTGEHWARDGPSTAGGQLAKFRGDFNKWYPLHRQLPMVARVMASRSEVLRKAERILVTRYSDAPDPVQQAAAPTSSTTSAAMTG